MIYTLKLLAYRVMRRKMIVYLLGFWAVLSFMMEINSTAMWAIMSWHKQAPFLLDLLRILFFYFRLFLSSFFCVIFLALVINFWHPKYFCYIIFSLLERQDDDKRNTLAETFTENKKKEMKVFTQMMFFLWEM